MHRGGFCRRRGGTYHATWRLVGRIDSHKGAHGDRKPGAVDAAVRNGKELTAPTEQVRLGGSGFVTSLEGESIPVDGVIVAEQTSINQASHDRQVSAGRPGRPLGNMGICVAGGLIARYAHCCSSKKIGFWQIQNRPPQKREGRFFIRGRLRPALCGSVGSSCGWTASPDPAR